MKLPISVADVSEQSLALKLDRSRNEGRWRGACDGRALRAAQVPASRYANSSN